MTEQQLTQALEAAYLAGFKASGEGYNGEYPFEHNAQNPAEDCVWKKDRDNYVSQALAQPKVEQERPQNCGTGFCSCIECVMEPKEEQYQYVGLLVIDDSGIPVPVYAFNKNLSQGE